MLGFGSASQADSSMQMRPQSSFGFCLEILWDMPA